MRTLGSASVGLMAATLALAAGGCIIVTNDCPAGQFRCGGVCVNLDTNVNNCGSCGFQCNPGEYCAGSLCYASTVCGDWYCDPGEDCGNCAADCGDCACYPLVMDTFACVPATSSDWCDRTSSWIVYCAAGAGYTQSCPAYCASIGFTTGSCSRDPVDCAPVAPDPCDACCVCQ